MKKNSQNQNLPKQHSETSIGYLLGDQVECYVLEDGRRVISKRGIQKALGISMTESGQKLEKFLLSFKDKPISPVNFNVIETGFGQGFNFARKGAGGAQMNTTAYDATFLMDICHFIQDLYLLKALPEEYAYLHTRATIVERTFAKLGIIAFIDEATGYFKFKKKNEYKKIVEQLLLEEFGDWKKMFDEEFFDVLWKIWLNKARPTHNKRPPFFGNIIRKYIYYPLAVKKLGLSEEGFGLLLKELDTKNLDRKVRHHQFLNDIGKEVLRDHITRFKTIGELSGDKQSFKNNFEKAFKLNRQLSLFEKNEV